MFKKLLSLLLAAALFFFSLPLTVVNATTQNTTNEKSIRASIDKSKEYIPNKVIVMYKNGVIDSETITEKDITGSAKKIGEHISSTFGSSAKSIGDTSVNIVKSTINQQVKILSKSLNKDFVIDDTVTFDNERKKTDIVISTITSNTMSTEQMIESLLKNPDVKYAEPEYIVHAESAPEWDDAYLTKMHHLFGDGSANVDTLWKSDEYAEATSNTVTEPVVVAVVDTGIDYTHPDLAYKMWIKPSSKAFSKFAGKYGYNFCDDKYDPMDDNGHGTHCAGIIAAEANNSVGTVGVAGVSDKVKLMAIKVLGGDGSGSNTAIVAGYKYVIELKKAGANIRVISCSLGGGGYSDIESEVLEKAGKEGILTVIAAGNSNEDIDVYPASPATISSDHRITVGAADEFGEKASFSNFGINNVDLFAPGCNILSASPFYNYKPFLYDANTLRGYSAGGKENMGNTAVYGVFEGATITKTTNIQGEIIDTVKPVTGKDVFGNPINDPGDPDHTVGEFDSSVILTNRVNGSSGKSALEISKDRPFLLSSGDSHLRWTITDAKAGDTYILYFPYEKDAGNIKYNMSSAGIRPTLVSDGISSGSFEIGDIIINGIGKNGKVDWSSMADVNSGSRVLNLNAVFNSLWLTYEMPNSLCSYSEFKKIKSNPSDPFTDFGFGFVFRPNSDGSCYFDIDYLSIPSNDFDISTLGKYDIMSGTSQATPVVSGSAAILAVMRPELTVEQLKSAVLSMTNDNFDGWCSTGGMIDLSTFSSSSQNDKPAIHDISVDFEADTVTIHGEGFGAAPYVKIQNRRKGTDFQIISVNDINVNDEGIVISNADKNYDIIGSEITFHVENTLNGKTGLITSYVVKGMEHYYNEFNWPGTYLVRENENPEYNQYFFNLEFVRGTDDFSMFDNEGNIYLFNPFDEQNQLCQIGGDASEAVMNYIYGIKNNGDREGSYWNKANDPWCYMSCDPVYLNGVYFELFYVGLEYMSSYILIGLHTEPEPHWVVYYDSLDDFGTKPEELVWEEVGYTTLAAYNERLYILGTIIEKEHYHGEDCGPSFTSNDISTDVFSCKPVPSSDEETNISDTPVEWIKEESPMINPRAYGIPVVQNGNLYYLLSHEDRNTFDYNVYKFDGKEWSVAGELPEILRVRDLKDYGVDFYDCMTAYIAIGTNEEGIVFGGTSFNSVGDTFIYDTGTNSVKQLPYTYWDYTSLARVTGTSAYGKLWVSFLSDTYDIVFKSIEISSEIKTEYSDVKESDWFYDAVNYSSSKGYFNGVSETEFNPQGKMTRAMFATVLYRMAGEPFVDGNIPFTDVESDTWFTSPVIWAAKEGLIFGYGNSEFGPDDSITREQIVAILYRYSGSIPVQGVDLSSFKDADEISSWATEAFKWAIDSGIIKGKDKDTLDPKGKATRAEVAQIIYNYASSVNA